MLKPVSLVKTTDDEFHNEEDFHSFHKALLKLKIVGWSTILLGYDARQEIPCTGSLTYNESGSYCIGQLFGRPGRTSPRDPDPVRYRVLADPAL